MKGAASNVHNASKNEGRRRGIGPLRLVCALLIVGMLGGVLALNVGPGPSLLARVVARLAEPYGIDLSIESARLQGLGRLALDRVHIGDLAGFGDDIRVEHAYITFDPAAVLSGEPVYDAVSRVELEGLHLAVRTGEGAEGEGESLTLRLDVDAKPGRESLSVKRFALQAETAGGMFTAKTRGAAELSRTNGGAMTGVVTGGPTEVIAGGHVYRLDSFDGTYAVSGAGLEIAQLTGTHGDARIQASGTVQPDGGFDFDVHAEQLALETDLPFLAAYGFAGPASFDGTLTGQGGAWRLEGESSVGPGTLWGRENVTGNGHLAWTQEGLSFADVRLYQYGGEYVLDGEWRFADGQSPGRLDLTLNTRSGRLPELLAVLNLPLPAAGRLYGEMRFFGPLNDVAAQGDIELVEAVIWDQPLDRVTGAFAWDGRRVTLDGVQAALGTGAASVNGQVDAENGGLNIAFSASDWPLGFTYHFDAALGHLIGGMVDVPAGRLGGTLQDPVLTADIAAEALRVGPALLRSVAGGLVYREHRLELADLHGERAGGGRYVLSGTLDLSIPGEPGADFELQVDGERLGSLLQLAGEQLPAALIDGAVSGRINVIGPFADPRAELDLLLQEAFALRRGLRVGMEYAGGALRVTGLELPKV